MNGIWPISLRKPHICSKTPLADATSKLEVVVLGNWEFPVYLVPTSPGVPNGGTSGSEQRRNCDLSWHAAECCCQTPALTRVGAHHCRCNPRPSRNPLRQRIRSTHHCGQPCPPGTV